MWHAPSALVDGRKCSWEAQDVRIIDVAGYVEDQSQKQGWARIPRQTNHQPDGSPHNINVRYLKITMKEKIRLHLAMPLLFPKGEHRDDRARLVRGAGQVEHGGERVGDLQAPTVMEGPRGVRAGAV
jgi:hypothetical protein